MILLKTPLPSLSLVAEKSKTQWTRLRKSFPGRRLFSRNTYLVPSPTKTNESGHLWPSPMGIRVMRCYISRQKMAFLYAIVDIGMREIMVYAYCMLTYVFSVHRSRAKEKQLAHGYIFWLILWIFFFFCSFDKIDTLDWE